MILNNIKTRQKDSGFTIVELLVVIVVIGILAAITIVSYIGITGRANKAANLSNANAVITAAEAVYADTGYYPVTSGNAYSALSNGVVKLPAGISVGNVQPTTSTKTVIGYTTETTPGIGVCAGYWDETGAGAVVYLASGGATVATCP